MPHCNREEFVLVAKPDCRFSHSLAVYLLPGLVFTKTLRKFEDRLTFHEKCVVQLIPRLENT